MRFQRVASFLILACACSPVFGQLPNEGAPVAPEAFISGAGNPSRLKLANLTTDYHALRIKTAGDSSGAGGLSSLLMSLFSMGQGQSDPAAMMKRFVFTSSLADLYFSTGKVTPFYGHDYLTTYRLVTGMSTAPGATPGSVAASLNLSLIRADQILSIDPEPDMTPDRLRKTLTDNHIALDDESLHAQSVSLGSSEMAIEAAILFPVFSQAKLAAQRTATLSNAKQVALGMALYCNDYDDVWPTANSTEAAKKAVYPYLRSNKVWESLNPNHAKLLYNTHLSGVSSTAIPEPALVPIVYESKPWPDGSRVVAFTDGHAKVVSKAMWDSQTKLWLNHRWKNAPKQKH